jgi:hypothetical protein
MGYTPDTPASEQITGPTVAQDINKFHVLRMNIQLTPGDPAATKVEVTWVEGYMDGEDFKPVKQNVELLYGQDVADKLASATGGGSIYDEVKAAVWSLLAARNLVGAGTVS